MKFVRYRAERAQSDHAEQLAWVVVDDDYVIQPEANAYLAPVARCRTLVASPTRSTADAGPRRITETIKTGHLHR